MNTQALAELWNKPITRCDPKGVVCAFAFREEGKSKCILDKCARYKRPGRRYESNRSRPR